MAGRRGFFRDIILRLDRRAAEQVQTDVQDALDRAGKSGAEALEEAMEQGGTKAAWTLRRILSDAYNQTIAEARVKFARGLIDQREFDRIRTEAARTFDQGLIAGMDRLRAQGDLTERQFRSLSRSLKAVGKEGPREVGLVSSAVSRLKNLAMTTAGALAALFAARRVVQFGAEARRAAEQGQADQRQLIQVLDNVGVAWAEVRGEVDATADSLWRTHRMVSGEVETALRELVSVTGDYGLSLEYIGLAQDVAAATGSGLEKSAQRVGRVLKGDYAWMRRFGWAAESTEEALALLQERTAGMAAAGTTGSEMLAKSMDDLRESIGLVLLEAEGGASIYETLASTARELTDWISRHRGDISGFIRGTIDALGLVGRFLGRLSVTAKNVVEVVVDAIGVVVGGVVGGIMSTINAVTDRINHLLDLASRIPGVDIEWRIGELPADQFFGYARAALGELKNDTVELGGSLKNLVSGYGSVEKSAEKAATTARGHLATVRETARLSIEAITQEVSLLSRGHSLRVLTTGEMVRALELERAIRDQLAQGNLSLEDRIRLTQQLQKLREIAPTAEVGELADSMGVTRPGWERMPGQLATIDRPAGEFDDVIERGWRWVEEIGPAMEGAAYGVAGSFQEMFEVLFTGFDNTGEAAKAMARSMGGALLGGLAEYASGKVKENAAAAIEETAKAFAAFGTPLMGTHMKAAATYTLAAAKWGLLAGAGGAGQSAIAGGTRGGLSGGIPTGARDTTGRLLEERRGPEVHIYIDPLDPGNPAWQRAVYAAGRYATDRYGADAHVSVHPRTGGR